MSLDTLETRGDLKRWLEDELTNNFGLLGFHQLAGSLPAGGADSTVIAPTAGRELATADLSLTGSLQDITGASLSVTPTVPSILMVEANFVFDIFNNGGFNINYEARGALVVDGTDQFSYARAAVIGRWDAAGANPLIRTTAPAGWAVPLDASAHTVKLQAVATITTGSGVVLGSGGVNATGFNYMLVAEAS